MSRCWACPTTWGRSTAPAHASDPRAIREASTLFSFGHDGAYDYEDDVIYLPRDKVRIVDVGDADIVHTDTAKSHENTRFAVRKILTSGALPVILGGDHAVHAPVIEAYAGRGPIHIVHIDAHLDFVDERHGVRYGHGNPLRRASETGHVTGMTQLGIRNVSSSNRSDYDAAQNFGSRILSVRQFRQLGVAKVLELIPAGMDYYVTIDIDGFDPVDRPRHRHAEPWRLPLLRGAGAVAGRRLARHASSASTSSRWRRPTIPPGSPRSSRRRCC